MTDNYNDELIKYAFTQGLYSLQVHGADSMNQAALLGLVSHIYIQFVRCPPYKLPYPI